MNEFLVIWAFFIHPIVMVYHFFSAVDKCYDKNIHYKRIIPRGNELWIKGIDLDGVSFVDPAPKWNATRDEIFEAMLDFQEWGNDLTKAYYYEIQYPDGDTILAIAAFPCQFSEIPG